jgi:hypothetical protein
MAMLDSAQRQELARLHAVVEKFNEQISKENPIIDRIYLYRNEYMKLDRKAQADNIRLRSVKRREPTQTELALDELDKKMQGLEGALQKIEGFRAEREKYLLQLRELLKYSAIEISLSPADEARVVEIDDEIARLDNNSEVILEASGMLRRAAGIMAGASVHMSGARRAAGADMFFRGGVIGLALAVKKNNEMKKARDVMAPAKKLIRKANAMLRSIDLKSVHRKGTNVPQISLFIDVFFDGYFVDAAIYDKISSAEAQTKASARKIARQAGDLGKMLETLAVERSRLEKEAMEIDVNTELAAASRLALDS